MGSHPSSAPKIFYGWILVVVLMLILSVGAGTSMYMYSVVAGAVGEEFAPSRFVLMAGSTGMFLVLGFCSPLLGSLLDRYPSKWTLITGALVMGLGFIAIALSTRVWMVVASYVVFIGVGAATLSTLTTATLLTRWFVRYRGLAIGIATLGTQLGGFIFPPIIASIMETYDWRIALGGLGVVIALVMPVVIWFLVVDRPEDMNLRSYGTDDPLRDRETTGAVPAAIKVSFAQLFTQRNFVLIVFIVGMTSVTNTTLLVNMSLFAMDLGEPAVRGAFLVSLLAVLGIFFSPFMGWLSDVISIKIVMAIVTLSLAAACLVFSVATSYSLLIVAVLLQGIGGGGVYPVWAAVVNRVYDTRVYGQVMGATTLFCSILTALAPLAAGWIYDMAGTYRLVFLSLLIILLLATFCTPLLRVPQTEEEKSLGLNGDKVVPAA